MARRRRSSKGDTALGMIAIIGAAVVFLFQFVQAHIPEILALGAAGASIWLLLKWLRWMIKHFKQKAASSISPVQSVATPTPYPASPARQAPRASRRRRFTPQFRPLRLVPPRKRRASPHRGRHKRTITTRLPTFGSARSLIHRRAQDARIRKSGKGLVGLRLGRRSRLLT